MTGGGGRGGGSDSGQDGSDIGSKCGGCCSGVGVGSETGSGEDGSGDCVQVMHTSDRGAGGGQSGITHTRGTGNSVYSSGVGGASIAPAAADGHFTGTVTPRTDLAPIIVVVAVSTAPVVSSVAFAASAGANDNGIGWGDFKEALEAF